MAVTTKQAILDKEAHSRVRIKEYVDSTGDIRYKIQRKRWFGWSTVYNNLGFPFYTSYNSLENAKKAANVEIEREINRLGAKSKYYYYPF